MMRQPAIPRHVLPNFMECDVCKRNITSANHYCHDCHLIFCDSCVVKEKEEIQVCSECGMNLFATDEKTGELFCRQCREEGVDNARIVMVQREKQVCPKCRSPNTSEIEDLKANLKDKYKAIVIDSRNVIDDFSSFTGMLSAAKQRLMKLRLELPVMIHEPGLEQEMLGLIEEGTLIERRIMNRIHNFFLFLRSKKPYLVDGKTWQNQDVAVLETYINQLQSDFLSFTAQVSESFNQPLEMLQGMKDRIEFLLTIKEFYIKYMNKGVINLDKSEYPVIHVEDVKMESDDDEQKGHGHVLLTTKFFKFIKSQGYIKKTDALLFSFPVSKLLSTDIIGRIFKRMALQFQGINLRFNMDKEKMQLLAKYFEQLLDFETQNKLDQDKIQRIKAFDVNSIFKIKTYIEENINALLNPGDASSQAVMSYYAGAAAGVPPGAQATTGQAGDLEFEPTLNAGGNAFGQGFQGLQGFPDPPRPVDATPYGQIEAAVFATDTLGGPYADLNAFQPAGFPADPVGQGILRHPAISTGDPRPFQRGYERAQAQGQQMLNPPCQQVDPRYHGQGFVAHQAQAVYSPQDTCVPNPGVAAQGIGQWGGGGAIRQPDAGAYQQRFQKAQEIRLLMTQLQAIEHRMVSIKETMRNLEAKFELGKIAANVYFTTHQLFSEKMIALNQEGQELRNRLATVQQASCRGPQY